MKKYILLIISLFALITVAMYITKSNQQQVNTATPIKIGTILSTTGIASAFGENARLGAELAVEEINSNGGIHGRTIILVNEDDRTDPKTAVGLYKKLTAVDHVDAIIGSNFDFVVNPLFAEAKKGDTVVVTPTSPRIAGALDTNENSFSMLSDFSSIVLSLDIYLTKTPYKKIAVIHYNGAFGKQITDTISTISVKNNKGIAEEEIYNEFGIADWTPYILKMKKSGVDIVFADMLGGDYLHFATQAKRLGFTAQLITHMDVREAITNKDSDKTPLEGTVVLNWDVLGSDVIFSQKFKEKYNREPDHFAAQSYLAVYAEAEVIVKSNNDRTKVAYNLESQTITTPLGTFSFNKDHTASKTKVKIQEIKNGKLVDLQEF